eukprot:SAG11_NODE_4286_length_1968_cov_1.533440_2_plen_154_part_00
MGGAGNDHAHAVRDIVKVPAGLAPGRWVLGWRYDCEATAQVGARCGAEPRPTASLTKRGRLPPGVVKLRRHHAREVRRREVVRCDARGAEPPLRNVCSQLRLGLAPPLSFSAFIHPLPPLSVFEEGLCTKVIRACCKRRESFGQIHAKPLRTY